MDQGRRVLLVDDQDTFREIIAVALQQEGYRVDLFDGGRRALEYLECGPRPDVILLDMFLQGDLNGWELAEQVKANPHLRDIPIVAMTGGALDTRWVETLRAEALLRKPFDLQVLLNTLARVQPASLPDGAAQSEPSHGSPLN